MLSCINYLGKRSKLISIHCMHTLVCILSLTHCIWNCLLGRCMYKVKNNLAMPSSWYGLTIPPVSRFGSRDGISSPLKYPADENHINSIKCNAIAFRQHRGHGQNIDMHKFDGHVVTTYQSHKSNSTVSWGRVEESWKNHKLSPGQLPVLWPLSYDN